MENRTITSKTNKMMTEAQDKLRSTQEKYATKEIREILEKKVIKVTRVILEE